MSDFWSWAGRTIASTQQTLDQAAKKAEQVAQEAHEVLDHAADETRKAVQGAASTVTERVADTAAKVAGEDSAVAQKAAEIHEAVAGTTDVGSLDLAALPEASRAAFYGALLAMAALDGSIDKEELELIFDLLDLDGLSDGTKRAIQGYLIQPPALLDALQVFVHGDAALRYGLMVNLIEVALANDLIAPEQRQAITAAGQLLQVSPAQVEAIEQFVRRMRDLRLRGLDDNYAAEAAKQAAAGLSAVGIPIAAVYLSGSVIGFSAAGITSGLAALGLGFGMVPGIGIAILLGTGMYMGVSYLLDAGGHREKERLRAEAARKAQLVIQHLQETINALIDRVQVLEGAAATVSANAEAIRELNGRLRALQQLLARRQTSSGSAG